MGGFSDSYNKLTPLLDQIKNAVPGPPDPVLGPITPDGARAKAYGQASAGIKEFAKDADGNVQMDSNRQPVVSKVIQEGAKDLLTDVVTALTSDQVQYLSGLTFQDASDDTKCRTDVVNSAFSAWDKSAAKYMKNDTAGGDSARDDLTARFKEFDDAIDGEGDPAVTPDS